MPWINHKWSSLLPPSNEVWCCKNCIASIFPFCSIDDCELYSLMNCRMPSHLEFLPLFDILRKISGIPHLGNSDIENNIPNPINSKYYYFHEFEKTSLSSDKSYFSLSQLNPNSLDTHLDDLHTTLNLLGSRSKSLESLKQERMFQLDLEWIVPRMVLICIRSPLVQLQVVLLPRKIHWTYWDHFA